MPLNPEELKDIPKVVCPHGPYEPSEAVRERDGLKFCPDWVYANCTFAFTKHFTGSIKRRRGIWSQNLYYNFKLYLQTDGVYKMTFRNKNIRTSVENKTKLTD